MDHPQLELPPNSLGNFDVGGAIGRTGYLHVTVDQGLGRPYTSSVELATGEVGEDINRYLVTSDQTGSVVIVGTHLSSKGVEAAGGLIVQLLPDHTEATICQLENNVTRFGCITMLMRKGMDTQAILNRILAGFEVRPLLSICPLRFFCKCSQERFILALKTFGPEDLLSMAREDGKAEGRCHFCNETYQVGRERLMDLAQGA